MKSAQTANDLCGSSCSASFALVAAQQEGAIQCNFHVSVADHAKEVGGDPLTACALPAVLRADKDVDKTCNALHRDLAVGRKRLLDSRHCSYAEDEKGQDEHEEVHTEDHEEE